MAGDDEVDRLLDDGTVAKLTAIAGIDGEQNERVGWQLRGGAREFMRTGRSPSAPRPGAAAHRELQAIRKAIFRGLGGAPYKAHPTARDWARFGVDGDRAFRFGRLPSPQKIAAVQRRMRNLSEAAQSLIDATRHQHRADQFAEALALIGSQDSRGQLHGLAWLWGLNSTEGVPLRPEGRPKVNKVEKFVDYIAVVYELSTGRPPNRSGRDATAEVRTHPFVQFVAGILGALGISASADDAVRRHLERRGRARPRKKTPLVSPPKKRR